MIADSTAWENLEIIILCGRRDTKDHGCLIPFIDRGQNRQIDRQKIDEQLPRAGQLFFLGENISHCKQGFFWMESEGGRKCFQNEGHDGCITPRLH